MPTLIVLAALSTLHTAGAAKPLPCPETTTPGVEECLRRRLETADAELKRYFDAAQTRLERASNRDPAYAKALAGLKQAQDSWTRFREAECGAVYDFWSGGTIRGAASIDCALSLTRLRTHSIWSAWLTYVDSTRPILPEPEVAP